MSRPGFPVLVLVAAAALASCQQMPGERPGGELKWVHNMAIDSKGNLYTAEVGTGRRAQKFKRVE